MGDNNPNNTAKYIFLIVQNHIEEKKTYNSILQKLNIYFTQ